MLKQSASVMTINGPGTGGLGQVFSRLEEFHDLISGRAFEIFEADGRPIGRQQEHWFRAESELLQSTPVEIRDSGSELNVRAEVPGFKPNEIDIMVEPWRLTVVGMRVSRNNPTADKLVHPEGAPIRVLRVIEFPRQMDTGRVTAKLKDGALQVTLSNAAAVESMADKSMSRAAGALSA